MIRVAHRWPLAAWFPPGPEPGWAGRDSAVTVVLRERGGGRDKETERQRDRVREGVREGHTHRHTHRHRHRDKRSRAEGRAVGPRVWSGNLVE